MLSDKEEAYRRKVEGELTEKSRDLQERLKELFCLYNLSKFFGQDGLILEEMLRESVSLIPSAW